MTTWQPARLIPTSGISGQEEQETRAASALLAVLPAVREFAGAVLRPLGAPAGTGAVETFIEVPFELGDGRRVRPDGIIRATRGQRRWTALVEVKTGSGELQREQVECYLAVAREQSFDAVITVSNQIGTAPGLHPLDVDKRLLKGVALHHFSWPELLSVAVTQRVHKGLADSDQAFILSELIRYLEHPRSGAMDFSDMGPCWTQVRDAVQADTLRTPDRGVIDVVTRFDQLLRFAALRLERELGTGVCVVLSRKESAEPAVRTKMLSHSLVISGVLAGVLRVPGSVGDMTVTTDLRTGRCSIGVEVPSPQEGRPLTRINWLVRQLSEAPDGLRVDAHAHMARASTSELLKSVRANPGILLPDARADIRRFSLTATSQLGSKRGVGRNSYIDSVLAAVDGFYASVLQDLRPWVPRAPQMPKSGSAINEAGIDTTVTPGEESALPALEEGQAFVGSAARDEGQGAAATIIPEDGEETPIDGSYTVASTESSPALGAREASRDDAGTDGTHVLWGAELDHLAIERQLENAPPDSEPVLP